MKEKKPNKGGLDLVDTIKLPVIESAGGLVCNRNHHVLLMFKRGKWDMPKGRLDDQQSTEIAALREVNEETGLSIKRLTIKGKLVSTWHTTSYNKKTILKKLIGTGWNTMAMMTTPLHR